MFRVLQMKSYSMKINLEEKQHTQIKIVYARVRTFLWHKAMFFRLLQLLKSIWPRIFPIVLIQAHSFLLTFSSGFIFLSNNINTFFTYCSVFLLRQNFYSQHNSVFEMANNIVDRFIDSTDSSQYASTFITATASIDSNITNSTETSFALNSATIDLLHHIIINSQQSTMTFMTTDTTIDVAAATANLFNESDNIHYPHAHVVNATHKLTTLTWHRTCLLMFFTSIIFITIFGNTLVILSVITTRRLRTVTNCFVMSLAVADWMVGVFVMPPAVLLYLYGKFRRATPCMTKWFGRGSDEWVSVCVLIHNFLIKYVKREY